MSTKMKNRRGFYIHQKVGSDYRSVRCEIIGECPDTGKITLYLPKYDQELTVNATVENLDMAGIYSYPSYPDGDFDGQMREIHGKKDVGTIETIIYGDIYTQIKLFVTREDGLHVEHVPITYLKGFSEDCPHLEHPENSVEISNKLIGKKVLVSYTKNGRVHHVMLMTPQLEKILLA